jgi:hypothetical protein
MKCNLFGFTLLRNGIKYDYSFMESLQSLLDLTAKVYLALGDSDDGTEEALKSLRNIVYTHTTWDEAKRQGGLILSEQTNIALKALRDDHGRETHSWGFYLQCDEVLHPDDFDLIKADVEKAQEQGCDAIAFRYLHFWQSHHEIAINKKWYPQEIRAIKLDSVLESWGDAQSFRPANKIYQSQARIFHYGHVREQDKYLSKKKDILKLYHSDQRMNKYTRREKRFDSQTKTLLYWGSHPQYMKARIERMGELYEAATIDSVYIIGKSEDYSKWLVAQINAKKVHFVESIKEVPASERKNLVIANPSFFQRLVYCSKVPKRMESKLALNWSNDFRLTLLLSEKGIGLKAQRPS